MLLQVVVLLGISFVRNGIAMEGNPAQILVYNFVMLKSDLAGSYKFMCQDEAALNCIRKEVFGISIFGWYPFSSLEGDVEPEDLKVWFCDWSNQLTEFTKMLRTEAPDLFETDALKRNFSIFDLGHYFGNYQEDILKVRESMKEAFAEKGGPLGKWLSIDENNLNFFTVHNSYIDARLCLEARPRWKY